MYSKRKLVGKILDDNRPPDNIKDVKVLFRGLYKNKVCQFGISNEIMSKHTLILGGTGSGKTNLFYHIVSQLKRNLCSDDVLIIFDSKGDFFDKFYENKDVVVANNSKYNGLTSKWNLFREILIDGFNNEEDYQFNARELSYSIFAERIKHSGHNAFFPNAAREVFYGILMAIIRYAKKYPERRKTILSNKYLKDFFNYKAREDIIKLLDGEPDFKAIIPYISGDSSQAQGVISELQSLIRDILIGEFAQEGDLSMRNLVRQKKGKTIFIEYDLSVGQVLSPIYSLLFDLALKEALGQSQTTGNIYLICDEFKLLPMLSHIEDAVNFGRSKGLKVFAGLQSIEQLYENYGKSKGQNIAAGFSSIYTFKANDSVTRKYVSDYFGNNIVLESYTNFKNESEKGEKRIGMVVEDWDLCSLIVGEAVVSLPNQDPFKFYFREFM